MTKGIAITFALLLAGCTTRPLQAGGSRTPDTGIYEFRVGPATGNCSQPTFSGPFEVPEVYLGVSATGAVTLQMPESTVDGNFALSTHDVVAGKSDETGDSCGAREEIRITIDETSANELTATRTDVWTNCAAVPRNGDLCAVIVPAADCTTSAQLHYTLAEACALPCHVKTHFAITPGQKGWLACVCPDSGVP